MACLNQAHELLKIIELLFICVDPLFISVDPASLGDVLGAR